MRTTAFHTSRVSDIRHKTLWIFAPTSTGAVSRSRFSFTSLRNFWNASPVSCRVSAALSPSRFACRNARASA